MADESSASQSETTETNLPGRLPVLPLRDVVIFPFMMFPILIGRESSLRAANEALERNRYILLLAQKDPHVEEPSSSDIHREGTVAKIVQVLKLPNGLLKVLVDGVAQAIVNGFVKERNFLEADVTVNMSPVEMTPDLEALLRHASSLFTEYVQLNRNIPGEVLLSFDNTKDPLRRTYYMAANLLQAVEVKQKILSHIYLHEQLYEIIRILNREIDILKIEREIDGKVHENIQKNQRKYFIQEQIRILQDELGDDESTPEYQKLRDDILRAKMPKGVKEKALEELGKLKRTPLLSPESTVLRNYVDWLIAAPWSKRTKDNLDIEHAREILEEDHFGLEKPKERILEHIAVLNLVKEMKGQILCFVGPPGVGKSSLAKGIARGMGRKFVRISLGGVRDEAEIRGHRRTYIGSMPGKIIQSMRRAGVVNPVMLLDEVDKMSMDFRGDPSAALLEVLDPEQNIAFNDHYLDVDYDLSSVLFITTANVRDNIPLPLQDRMEIIELPGYLEYEKIEIAERHILPRQLAEHGLRRDDVVFRNGVIRKIVREYTREAGVRNLEREIASVCRKSAKEIVETRNSGRKRSERRRIIIDAAKVESYLGVPRFRSRAAEKRNRVGSVTGLAWTSVGGEILTVEATVMRGPEKLTLTGHLGDVMKESAQAALSFIRSNARKLGVDPDFSKGKEIHIHVPEGAIPKDGPSAGITMAMAILSAVLEKPVRSSVAMTGEITLRGSVLAIGGLNEKLLAAQRSGIRTVLIPRENEKDLAEIQPRVKDGLTIILIDTIVDAIAHVFARARGERTARRAAS